MKILPTCEKRAIIDYLAWKHIELYVSVKQITFGLNCKKLESTWTKLYFSHFHQKKGEIVILNTQ